jgi:RNA polymerase sigma-70 factor (ECF subfamily)
MDRIRTNTHRTPEQVQAWRDDDARLADALLSGEPGAEARAWVRLSPLVRRIVAQHFPSSSDAADLCQEVFLRFFSRIGELRARAALRSFLIGICLGVVQNERRRARVRRDVRLLPPDQLPEQLAVPVDPEARQALRRLGDLLDGVTADERRLFAVRHIEKAQFPEIAARSGWSLRQAKRRTALATRRITRRLRHDPLLADYVARMT